MTLTTPLISTYFHKQTTIRQKNHFVPLSRLIRLALLFAYTSLPMWAIWLASQAGLYAVSSVDMLIAMSWLPISGAIIALSFMKFGWKDKLKGLTAFIFYNSIVFAAIALLLGVSPW